MMSKMNFNQLSSSKFKSGLVALTVASLLTLSAFNPALARPAHDNHHAQPEHGMHHEMQHRMFRHMAHMLSLTEQQIQQAKQIRQAGRQQAEPFKAMLKSYQDELQVLLTAEQFDEQAVLALRAKYQDTFSQLAVLRAKQKFEFFQILTPEQKIKLQEWLAKRGDAEQEPVEP